MFKKLFVCASAIFALAGCGAVDKVLDCNRICTKYRDCFSAEYDVGACTNKCQAESDDEDYRRKADTCNACLNNQSCAGATFGCAADCVGIVP